MKTWERLTVCQNKKVVELLSTMQPFTEMREADHAGMIDNLVTANGGEGVVKALELKTWLDATAERDQAALARYEGGFGAGFFVDPVSRMLFLAEYLAANLSGLVGSSVSTRLSPQTVVETMGLITEDVRGKGLMRIFNEKGDTYKGCLSIWNIGREVISNI